MNQSSKSPKQIQENDDNTNFNFYLRYVKKYGDNDMGEQVGKGFTGHRERLEKEKESILNAVLWGLSKAPVEAVGLIEKITTFLLDAGYWRERRDFTRWALEIAREQHLFQSEIGLLTRLGWSYLILWDYESAFTYLTEAYALAKSIESNSNIEERLIQIERDLAHIYSLQGDFSKAFELYDLSENRAKQIGQEFGIVWAETHRARTQYLTGEPNLVLKAKQKCLQLSQELEVYPRQLIIVYKILTRIALANNELDEAEGYLAEAQADLKLRPYYQALEEVHVYLNWGDLHTRRNNLDEALSNYNRAHNRAVMLGMPRESQVSLERIENIKRADRKHFTSFDFDTNDIMLYDIDRIQLSQRLMRETEPPLTPQNTSSSENIENNGVEPSFIDTPTLASSSVSENPASEHYIEAHGMLFADENALIGWETRQAVQEIAKNMPLEERHPEYHPVSFDPEHKRKGLSALFSAGSVIASGKQGVLLVPSRSLEILKALNIPYQAVSLE